MSANPGTGDGGSDSIVDSVLERVFERLVSVVLLAAGSIGAAFVAVGDALEAGLIDPVAFVAGSVGDLGDSLLDVVVSLDKAVLSAAEAAGPAAPVVVLAVYATVGFVAVYGASVLLARARSVIPLI